MASHQRRGDPGEIDSSINRLTYAFGANKKPAQPHKARPPPRHPHPQMQQHRPMMNAQSYSQSEGSEQGEEGMDEAQEGHYQQEVIHHVFSSFLPILFRKLSHFSEEHRPCHRI